MAGGAPAEYRLLMVQPAPQEPWGYRIVRSMVEGKSRKQAFKVRSLNERCKIFLCSELGYVSIAIFRIMEL